MKTNITQLFHRCTNFCYPAASNAICTARLSNIFIAWIIVIICFVCYPTPLVAQIMPCATEIMLPDAENTPNGEQRMGPVCRNYMYGSYGTSCDFTDCSIPPLLNSSCPDYRIPLVCTLVRNNSGSGSANETDFSAALAEANNYYSAALVQFVVAEVRYINDSDLYNFVAGSTDSDDGIDDDTEANSLDYPGVLNVYIVENLTRGGFPTCGYAYFPGSYTSGASLSLNNRAVLRASCIGAGDASLAHELGHLLGLQHTHNGASNNTPNEASNGSGACLFGEPNTTLAISDPNNPSNKGDGIADTPPDPSLNGLVNLSCQYTGSYVPHPSQPLDLQNIMSYTRYSSCQPVHFSACQLRKIQDILLQCRDYLCSSNIGLDFSSTAINNPDSPYWEICVGDPVPTLHAINSCYNWYSSATASTPIATQTAWCTPTAIVNNQLAGTYEIWVEEVNNYAIDNPCRRKATVTVLPEAGTAAVESPTVCCNETMLITTIDPHITDPYTAGFWIDTAPVTNGNNLTTAAAQGKIFAAQSGLNLPANVMGFEFSPNCGSLPAGNYYVTPFISYQNLPAPTYTVGPNANIAIPDFPNTAGVAVPISVYQLPTDARLSQICLFVQHAFTNDLSISLFAPNNAEIPVVTTFSLSGFGVNIGTSSNPACFVSSGGYNAGACNGNSYPTPPCYTGSINSDSPLNVNVGNPNGTWTLHIADNNNAGAGGSVQYVRLIFDQDPYTLTFPTAPSAQNTSCIFGNAAPFTIVSTAQCNVPTAVSVRLKAFLEGCYNGSASMTTQNSAVIPLTQPYSGTFWNYTGSEVLSTLPAMTTDWVLIEAYSNDGNTLLEQKAAVLLSNGEIVQYNNPTSGVLFNTLTAGNMYRFVVRHRNHLAVMSQSFVVTNQTHSNIDYDFTTTMTQAIGTNQQKQIGDRFVLLAGDLNNNGVITAIGDGNTYFNFQGNGYRLADLNFDGMVNNQDFVLFVANAKQIGAVEIR